MLTTTEDAVDVASLRAAEAREKDLGVEAARADNVSDEMLGWLLDGDLSELAPHPIQSDADFRAALAKIYAFDDATYERGTPASDRLDRLVDIVRAYEAALMAQPSSKGADEPPTG